MSQQFSYSRPRQDKAMTNEQFEQIVEAILAGKYSWACVLILRFGGYNPLHYIPYRTYNRLIKDNCLGNKSKLAQKQNLDRDDKSFEIEDLSYLENERQSLEVRGGYALWWCV